MKITAFAAAAAMTLAMGAAAPASSGTAIYQTCHEQCRIRCIGLYPGNQAMQDLCTWSCIDQKCGGGPFP